MAYSDDDQEQIEDKIVNAEGWSQSSLASEEVQSEKREIEVVIHEQDDQKESDKKEVEEADQLAVDIETQAVKGSPQELNSIIEEDNQDHDNTNPVREESPE